MSFEVHCERLLRENQYLQDKWQSLQIRNREPEPLFLKIKSLNMQYLWCIAAWFYVIIKNFKGGSRHQADNVCQVPQVYFLIKPTEVWRGMTVVKDKHTRN